MGLASSGTRRSIPSGPTTLRTPLGAGPPLLVDGAFDPSRERGRRDPDVKEARARSLEEPFEQSLERGEGSHQFRTGPQVEYTHRGHCGTFGRTLRYVGPREAAKPTVYSRPADRAGGAGPRAHEGLMAEILTESFC